MSKHGTPLEIGQFAEFSASIIRRLPRTIDPGLARAWENNGEELEKALRAALVPPKGRAAPNYPSLLTVDIDGLVPIELIKSCEDAGIIVTDVVKEAVGRIVQSPGRQRKMRVGRLTVGYLAEREGEVLVTDKVMSRIARTGNLLTVTEALYALRAYRQPCGDWLYIAMNPIIDHNGKFAFLASRHDGKRQIIGLDSATSQQKWRSSVPLLFGIAEA